MSLFNLLLAYLMTLGIGVLMLFTPALSRGNTFFAVTVPKGFAFTEIGRTIKRRYAALVSIPTLLALATIAPVRWLFSGELAAAIAYGIVPLVPVVGGLVAFVHCRGVAMRFSQDAPSTRQVSLRRDSLADIVPRPYWLHLAPYLLLAAAAGWLALNWSSIPDSAYLPSDLPDARRDSRSILTVFGLPLGMAATLMLCHATMLLGLLIRRLPGHRRRVRAINTFLLAVIWAMAVMGAYDSLAVLYGERWVTGAVGLIVNIGAPLAVLLIPVWMLLTGRFAPAGEPQQGDRSPDSAWKLGLVYFNPDDPALFVEKRFGVGYTVNFARPGAWIFIGGILVGTGVVVVWAFSV